MMLNVDNAVNTVYGIEGNITNDGVSAIGIRMFATGSTSATKHGGIFAADGTGPENYGGEFSATFSDVCYGVKAFANYSNTYSYGVNSEALGGDYSYGVFASATGSAILNCGVNGTAINSATTDNIGVRGEAQYGALTYGVYGKASGNPTPACSNTSCNQAGVYSNGDMFTMGTMYQTSDVTLKTNLNPLDSIAYLLNQINVKTFEFDSVNYPMLTLPKGVQYGLIAQELEQVLPEFVKTFTEPATYDSTGQVITNPVSFKSVSYVNFVPLLLAGFKEQQNRITLLENQLAALIPITPVINPTPASNHQKVTLSNINSIILNQNDPNPFIESTRITFQIPDEVRDAKIIFTSSTGSIINTVIINERGAGELEVYSSELSKGLYTYTLVCDGKVISSKKMVKQ